MFRRIFQLPYKRERVETPDGDFLDLDWSEAGADKLMLCIHGLEGNARRPYMSGMMKRFNTGGWDAVGMNLRGCSGEDNRYLQGYHSGKSEDLDFILKEIISRNKYKEIALVGFSVGGNICLKYAGEISNRIPSVIKHIVGISVPVDLVGCSLEFETAKNWVYLKEFLKTLKEKAIHKARLFPNQFDIKKVLKARTFRDFDNHYTAPINGFIDAMDYWQRVSSVHFIKNITIPTLLINAKDDTFLSPTCFPHAIAERMPHFFLELPRYGGHLGFMKPDKNGFLWTEHRAWEFING
jgi:hypothetical protein